MANHSTFAQNSVLASGDWYKIGIIKTGIYKIDANFLKKLGLDPNTINLKNIRIFGNNDGMLPQKNSAIRPIDLRENACQIIQSNTSNAFSEGNYLIFLGISPDEITYNKIKKTIQHNKNIYSDTAFYFINISENEGKRINQAPIIASENSIETYDDYQYVENEEVNILQSGKKWFEKIETKNINFETENIVKNSDIFLNAALVSTNITEQSNFNISFNNSKIGRATIARVEPGPYTKKANLTNYSTYVNEASINQNNLLNIEIKVLNDNGINTYGGLLDYLSIQTKKTLQFNGKTMLFYSFDSHNFPQVQYKISNPNQRKMNVWDITDANNAQLITENNTNSSVSFGSNTSISNKFIAFDLNEATTPISSLKIKNQNLHQLPVPNMVIVAPPNFKQEAERLAKHRSEHDNLNVTTVLINEIYNEFSSGKQDITAIRDFCKMLYQKNPLQFKYLLLFGDASYDYKKIQTQYIGESIYNEIPTYQSNDSFRPTYTFCSDDYFGLLENSEGEWNEDTRNFESLDIGIGRLPAKYLEEAKNIVDKIIAYDKGTTNTGYNNWKNTISLVADDEDWNVHQNDAEKHANSIYRNNPSIEVNKVYLDAYLQTITPNVESKAANKAVVECFNNGSLVINYSGHGDEREWAAEKLLTLANVENFANSDRLPLLFTATCQFGKFDNPGKVTSAELLLLQPKGGAIGLMTTTRPVYQNSNYIINEAFYNNLFKKNTDGSYKTLGEILKNTKNISIDSVKNRNFTLLGDPSMKLKFPENKILITHLNNKFIQANDTLKAGAKPLIRGEIINPANNKIETSFNGIVRIKIFDKLKKVKTLGAIDKNESANSPFEYQLYNSLLYDGTAKVTNGVFEFSFTVSKNIEYQIGKGKIYLFAENSTNNSTANGYLDPLIGSDIQSEADVTPPKVTVMFDNSPYTENMILNSYINLKAKLFDENGINRSNNNLLHEATIIIDQKTEIKCNNYITSLLDNPNANELNFSFLNLKPGNHIITLKIWDNNNNLTEQSFNISVVAPESKINKLKVFPNPFKNVVNFEFENPFVGEDIQIDILFITTKGIIISTISKNIPLSGLKIEELKWEINDSFKKMSDKTYFYSIFVKSLNSGNTLKTTGKLLLAN
ncbi:MAG: type IX secretion system sortase PorU [Pseudarcicella sp.]|nr:type IX secretion system sortase PorU [Pseudarcicella sp.]